MDKKASIAKTIMGGVKWGLKKSAPALAVGTAVSGTVAGGRALHRSYKALPMARNATSGYQKHVAKNLRNGNLGVNNLSVHDMGTAQNMYKISSLSKVAFLGKMIMPALTVGMIPGDSKENAKKFQLKAPDSINNRPAPLEYGNYKYGINNK